jgi:cyclopropane fatty-acyl-phospholipid synthase-like methyltransferase
MNEALPFSEACERNKSPILEVLQEHLPKRGFILEIGSGTGQHAVFFANALSTFKWQPSDVPANIPSLAARIEQEGGENLKQPIPLDVLNDDLSAWPERILTAAFSANTTHIMSWEMVRAMFTGLGQKLKPRGVFILYGPFNQDGQYTSDSNRNFDLQLKSQNPEMGLRDVRTLETLAGKHDMTLKDTVDLPANNKCLVFAKNDVQR